MDMKCAFCGGTDFNIDLKYNLLCCKQCGVCIPNTVLIGDKINNPDDFVIVGGILKKYKGSDTNVIVPASVCEIGKGAFECNDYITTVIIPEGVTAIHKNAFYGCYNLVSVKIPYSVELIGETAFSMCKSLESVFIPKGVKTMEKKVFSWCKKLKTCVIDDGVTSIPEYTFEQCVKLTDITIPDSVTYIGAFAFSHCTSLKHIKLPEFLPAIEYGTFFQCSALEELILPENTKRIRDAGDAGCFSGCTSLMRIVYPAGFVEHCYGPTSERMRLLSIGYCPFCMKKLPRFGFGNKCRQCGRNYKPPITKEQLNAMAHSLATPK